MVDYILPLLLFTAALGALRKKESAYDLMLTGAADGIKLMVRLVPCLILLLTAVGMLRASGGIEILSRWFSPLFGLLGIPPETAILVLIRPISGSAALAVGADLMAE